MKTLLGGWILMLVLGALYHLTGAHWYNGATHHSFTLALGYWWCVLLCFTLGLIN